MFHHRKSKDPGPENEQQHWGQHSRFYQQEQEQPPDSPQEFPQFTFLRTTTESEEVISPPHFPGDTFQAAGQQQPPQQEQQQRKRSRSFFRRGSHTSTDGGSSTTPLPEREHRTLGEKLHLTRSSRSASASSVNLPQNLPDAPAAITAGNSKATNERGEAEWEQRAALLAKSNSISRTPSPLVRGQSYRGVSDAPSDDHIQKAIRLHEDGDLARSTEMFGRLAAPAGANNALAQVLYGLALRHGWGCAKNEEKAIHYLSMAASNSADIEAQALRMGSTRGGAAKGELTIAIFELANCFRNGWGVKKDAVAAKQYYETAANMGDTDALNEISWCYLEGFGCKKDKFKAAQYLRLAEEKGAPSVGNAWIWKDKYGGPKKIPPQS